MSIRNGPLVTLLLTAAHKMEVLFVLWMGVSYCKGEGIETPVIPAIRTSVAPRRRSLLLGNR